MPPRAANHPFSSLLRRTSLLALLTLLAPLTPACERSNPVAVDPWPAGLAKPTSVAEAQQLKTAGVVWTDRQARQLYLERVAAIGPADDAARTRADAPETRARAAFTARHDARKIARAMMQDASAVAALEARDRDKYGDPDGPTFEWLVERNTGKGLAGAAIFEAIVASAQQTDAATNASLGL
jgi:hypothetical protein